MILLKGVDMGTIRRELISWTQFKRRSDEIYLLNLNLLRNLNVVKIHVPSAAYKT